MVVHKIKFCMVIPDAICNIVCRLIFLSLDTLIMTPEQIQQLIASHMPDATVEVSGGEGKFIANVTSDVFASLTTIKRHQLVYASVNDEIASGELHALTIIAKTPAEPGSL
jgi:acid stress-induced BolA-like protein IbaG/YrbA